MTKFSQSSINKLKVHLENLKTSTRCYKNNQTQIKEKNFHHTKILTRNKTLVNELLIQSIFLNLEVNDLNQTKLSLLKKILLKNKNIFINKKIYNNAYLSDKNLTSNKLLKYKENLKVFISYFGLQKYLKEQYYKNIKTDLIRISKTSLTELQELLILGNKKFDNSYNFLRNNIFGKWYIYLSRWFVISFLHFVPFIQLTSSLFYNQPNKYLVHPIIVYLFNFVPFLVPMLNFTMPVLNNDTISFLLIVPYLYFFIYSFRKYKISRKIAYQGSFALALMIFRYSLLLLQESLTIIYKLTRRFFFLGKSKNLDLLRDDFNFYIEDLEELRNYKEGLLQLGESVFSLADITKIAKVWECFSIFPLLGVIALLYNYMYFILRGQKPIIPVITKTVRRMMIDRNGEES